MAATPRNLQILKTIFIMLRTRCAALAYTRIYAYMWRFIIMHYVILYEISTVSRHLTDNILARQFHVIIIYK